MRRVAVVAVFAVLMAMQGNAQTNDVLYGSWRWGAIATGPKGLGMGGAQVAVADDASALPLNPAVLSTLTKTEFFGSGVQISGATVGRGDRNGSRTAIGATGGGALLTPKLAIGGFIIQPRSVNTSLNTSGTGLSGSLRSVVTDVGVGVALRLSPRAHVGAQLIGTHLELEGLGARLVDEREVFRVGTSSGSTRVVGAAGALFEMTPSLSLGLAATSGAAWGSDRTAINPVIPVTIDPGSQYDVQRPFRSSAGVAWQATRKIRVLGQLDYVAYGMIRNAVVFVDPVGPMTLSLDGALEPRGGVEVSLPVKNTGSLQLRAGFHSRAAGAFTSMAGTDARFPGVDRELEASGGVSLVLQKIAVHAAYVAGADAPLVSVGGSIRF